jgi:hypothetical protein
MPLGVIVGQAKDLSIKILSMEKGDECSANIRGQKRKSEESSPTRKWQGRKGWRDGQDERRQVRKAGRMSAARGAVGKGRMGGVVGGGGEEGAKRG